MINLIRDMWEDGWFGRFCLLLILSIFLLSGVAIRESIKEEHQWQQFIVDHNCQKVGEIKGSVQSGVGFGIMPNGQMGTIVTTQVEPDRIGWTCDDGVTYWR